MIWKEKVKAVEYTMGFKDFRGTNEEWTNNIWLLFNCKNSYSHVLKLDVLQGSRDENGFYPNFIKLIVKDDGMVDWDGYLSGLNYGFKKANITLLKIEVEWDEGLDEVIADFDI